MLDGYTHTEIVDVKPRRAQRHRRLTRAEYREVEETRSGLEYESIELTTTRHCEETGTVELSGASLAYAFSQVWRSLWTWRKGETRRSSIRERFLEFCQANADTVLAIVADRAAVDERNTYRHEKRDRAEWAEREAAAGRPVPDATDYEMEDAERAAIAAELDTDDEHVTWTFGAEVEPMTERCASPSTPVLDDATREAVIADLLGRAGYWKARSRAAALAASGTTITEVAFLLRHGRDGLDHYRYARGFARAANANGWSEAS